MRQQNAIVGRQVMKGENVLSGVLTSGTAVILSAKDLPLPATVWVEPVAGDTVTISFSLNGGLTYNTCIPNVVTTVPYYNSLVTGITNIKFQRTAGSGTTSTFGVC